MIVIGVSNLSVAFGTRVVFEGVSFALNENDKMGIIGTNGCGKTTLLHLILGEGESEGGNIFISNGKTVGILRQDGLITAGGDDDCGDDAGGINISGGRTYESIRKDASDIFDTESGGFSPDSTPSEIINAAYSNLKAMEDRLSELQEKIDAMIKDGEETTPRYLSLTEEYTTLHTGFLENGGLEYRARALSALARLGFDGDSINRPVSTLSGGQRTRLALAVQLCSEPDILLLDEPTNHLDIETLTWLEGWLCAYKKCVIVVSHDRYFLDRVTNKTLHIEFGRGKLYNGNYSKSMAQRDADRKAAKKQYDLQQKEIARQEAYIANQRKWNRERNIIAAESRLKLLDKMEKIEAPKEAPRPIRLKFTKQHASGNDVLNIKDLSMGFGERMLFENLNALIKKGERVFITGPNGCGKSTLIKLMMAKLEPVGGYIEAGYNVDIGYYDQENQNLTAENTVLDEIWNAYPARTETDIRSCLAMFRFFGDDVYKSVGVLSGGERARLTLAKLILSHMNLLILDEPTNHLDIDSREALEVALSDFDGTVITVSHDRYFIDKTATRIIEINPALDGGYYDYRCGTGGESNRTPTGNAYTEYTEFKQRLLTPREDGGDGAAASSAKAQYLENKKSIADERKKQHRTERLTAEAAKLEAELDEITKLLTGEAASDYVRLTELGERQAEIEERLLVIYEEIGV